MKDMNFSEYKKMKRNGRANPQSSTPTSGEAKNTRDVRRRPDYQAHTADSQYANGQPYNIPVRRVPREYDSANDIRSYSQNNAPYRNAYQPPQNGSPYYNGQYNGYYENIPPEVPPSPPVKPRKKKKHGFSRFLLSILLIVAILGGTVFGYAYSLCSKTTYVKSDYRKPVYSSVYESYVYNVLLVGTDKESNGASRSDTMMLLSIDRKNQQLKITSFLRDIWVEIPDHGNAKLNAAFAYGGADLMMRTIEWNFKIRIDNYILVDFDMFKALIDGLGGVDVEITAKEAKFINRTTHAKVTEGINHLDGDYALIYCRIRKLDSDFMRTQRQRKVMTAIIRQVQENGIFKATSAATDVLPYITTDINSFKLTLNAFGALKYISYESDQIQIPLNEAYKNKRIDGQSVLSVDFDKNIDALHSFIYNK